MSNSVDKPKPEEEVHANGTNVGDDGDEIADDAAAEGEPGIGGKIRIRLQLSESFLTGPLAAEVKKKKKKKKPKKKKLEQTDPPRIGISKFFPDGIYPEGEIQPYKDEWVQ